MNIVGGFNLHTDTGIRTVIAYDPGRKYIRILHLGYLRSEKMRLTEWELARKEQVATDWSHVADNVASRSDKFPELVEAMRAFVEGPLTTTPIAKSKLVRRG